MASGFKLGNYCCPDCETVLRDVHVPFGTTFNEHVEICPRCNHPRGGGRWVRMDWLPQIGRMSAANGPTFVGFDTTDSLGNPIHIGSIAELRKVESESAKMARDGIGQPMIWRDLQNDQSNKDVHAIHGRWEADDYPGAPTKAALQRMQALTEPQFAQKQDAAVAPLDVSPQE